MGFWLAMTGCVLLIPVIMILVGAMWKKDPPEQINWVYGYRTAMSMKNQKTWDFAHAHCAKIWWRVGWGMLLFSLIGMFCVFGKSDGTVGIAVIILETAECIALMLSMVPTEWALKKNFDKDGNRKE